MPPRSSSAFLLLGWGLTVLLGGGILYYPGERVGVAGGLRWLTLLVAVLLGASLLWDGIRLWQGDEGDRRQNQRPALTLGLVGLVTSIGSVFILRPWAFDGLTGGVRAVGLWAFLVVGGLFIVLGAYCYRTQNQRLPLALFAGLTGAGVFYPLDTSGVVGGLHPLLWVATIMLLVGGPALGVYFRCPPAYKTSLPRAG